MSKTIFVGNLPFSATEQELETLFAEHGAVTSVRLMKDRLTGKPRGFAFVEMEDDDATAAMEALNGAELGGRALRIDEARERESRGPRRDNGGGGGGYSRRSY